MNQAGKPAAHKRVRRTFHVLSEMARSSSLLRRSALPPNAAGCRARCKTKSTLPQRPDVVPARSSNRIAHRSATLDDQYIPVTSHGIEHREMLAFTFGSLAREYLASRGRDRNVCRSSGRSQVAGVVQPVAPSGSHSGGKAVVAEAVEEDDEPIL